MRCIDEGTLQAWFDDELDANVATDVAAHLHDCLDCAEAARMLEAENLILSKGLSAEFAEAVPTERLHQRVEAAVAGLSVSSAAATRRSWVDTVRNLLPSFRVVSYASLAVAILIAGIFIAINLRKEKPAQSAGQVNPREVAAPAPQTSPAPPREVVAGVYPKTPASPRPKPSRKQRAAEPDAMSVAWIESQYQKAFPQLNEAIKAQTPLRPSLRVKYEYDLALIDNTITTTSRIARKNPKDPLATQSMLAAYQSKIDLMNEVAQGRVSEPPEAR